MLICRTERPGDGDEIDELVTAAFGREQEADLVWALREQGAISLSQVVEYDDAILGHLLMSPVFIEGKDCGWLGLSPISVWPECQRQGVASALITAALDCANELDWAGVVLLGNPAFYGRFGFKPAAELGLEYASAHIDKPLLAMPLKPPTVTGQVTFHEVFDQ